MYLFDPRSGRKRNGASRAGIRLAVGSVLLLLSAGGPAAQFEAPPTIDETDPEFWSMTQARVAQLGPEAFLARARALLAQVTPEDGKRAISLLQKAAGLYGEDAAVLAELARASIAPYRWTWDRDEEWIGRADRLVRSARRIDPDAPEVHRAAGLLAMVDNRLEEAEAGYRAALEARPDDVDTLLLLGAVLRLQERFREAYAVYVRAIEIDASDWRGHAGMADVYRDDEWYEEALNLYAKAELLHPEAFLPRFGRVLVYQRTGFHPIAKKYQLELLRDFPRWDHLVLLNAAIHHMRQDRHHEALAELDQIELGGRRGLCQGSVLYRKGVCRRRLGDLDGAAQDLGEAIAGFPDARDGSDYGPLVLFAGSRELAAVQDELGQPQAATTTLELAAAHAEAPLWLQLLLATRLSEYNLHDRAAGTLARGIEGEREDDHLYERLRARVDLCRALAAAEKDGAPAVALLDAIAPEVRDLGAPTDFVSMARGYALAEQQDRAVDWLREAVDRGYTYFDAIRAEDDLEPLRGMPAYRSLMKGR